MNKVTLSMMPLVTFHNFIILFKKRKIKIMCFLYNTDLLIITNGVSLNKDNIKDKWTHLY